MSDFEVNLTPNPAIQVTVSGGVGPQGPAGPTGPAGGVTSVNGAVGALTLAAVGGSWAVSGTTLTLTVTAAGAVAWNDITGKPSTFTPSAHSHTISDVSGLQAALDGKQASGSYAAASHSHVASDVTDFSSAALSAVTWTTLTGKPTFAAVATSGAYADLTGTPAAYSLPAATVSTLGGIIVGTGLSVASGTVSVTFGSTAGTVCAGDDARLSNARTPTGAAGGDLTGSYPNPSIAAGAVTLAKTTGIQKAITSGTAAPTGGSDGDIYLRYQ